MLIEGTLNRYLADINQQAEQMFHRLIEEMARKQGVTEQLKIERPMEWIVFLIFLKESFSLLFYQKQQTDTYYSIHRDFPYLLKRCRICMFIDSSRGNDCGISYT